MNSDHFIDLIKMRIFDENQNILLVEDELIFLLTINNYYPMLINSTDFDHIVTNL